MHRSPALWVLLILALGSLTPAAAQGPGLTVQAPADGAIVEGTDVKVAYTATGIKIVPSSVPVSEAGKHPEANKPGEGHIHLVLDLQPLVVWEKTEPYTFTNVPPGQHQLMVELVNNDHSSLSPPIMQRISFRSTAAPAQQLPRTGAPQQQNIALILLGLSISLMIAGSFLLRHRRG